ncbi:hypothetical protein BJ508DRAFT_419471 [Ascobolus immersus RN42]|uniref:RING-type domain-containing protein n=1 Tax=Ascobolus immersus RN42 TaxID=1160509 RepID=A0A3N4HKJ8_ASCIM|nr:hypothetical protein BJ508DRAFT_419471 [Ascobolus immersus RN42]
MSSSAPASRRNSAISNKSTSTTTPDKPTPTHLDLRTLRYVSPPDDNLCCPICHSPFLDPIQTRCRHTFCSDCIAEALKNSETCPIDRKPITDEGLSPAPILIANMVNDLVVYCPNAENGCTETVPRHLVEGHVRETCGWVQVECGVGGCKEMVRRNETSMECLHRLVKCEFCLEEVRRMDLDIHYDTCAGISTDCPHCLTDYKRSDWKSHVQSCPEASIPCSSSVYGCPTILPRREMARHESTCSFVHLTPVFRRHESQISELALENRMLRRRLDLLYPRATQPESNTNSEEPQGPSVLDEQTYHILSEQEHLRTDLDRLSESMVALEMKHTMHFINENMRVKEEMVAMRTAINGVRMQMHWLLNMRAQAPFQPMMPMMGMGVMQQQAQVVAQGGTTTQGGETVQRRHSEHQNVKL